MHIPIFIQVFCNFGLSRHTLSLSKAFMPHWSHQGIGFTSMTLRSRFLPQTSATPDIHQKRLQANAKATPLLRSAARTVTSIFLWGGASTPNFQEIVTSHYIVVVVPQPQRGIELSGYQTKIIKKTQLIKN